MGAECQSRLYLMVGHSPKAQVETAAKQTYLWTARSWLTLYRLMFAAIVVANLIVVILASTGNCDWGSLRRVQFAVANTLITVLTRNEVCHVVFYCGCFLLCAFY